MSLWMGLVEGLQLWGPPLNRQVKQDLCGVRSTDFGVRESWF